MPNNPVAPYDPTDAEAAAAAIADVHGAAPASPLEIVPVEAPRYTDADLHRHDVLSGRGGYVNAHPGNHHLRTICQYRKAEWDAGTTATKRRIAIEIYGMVRALNPPGRFLKKEIVPASAVKAAAKASKKGKKAEEDDAAATAAAVAAEVIAGAANDAAASAGEFL